MVRRNKNHSDDQTLIWNPENRLAKVTEGGTVLEEYIYDPNGIRVKKWNGNSASYYINPFYEVETGDGSVSAAQKRETLNPFSDESKANAEAAADLYLPLVTTAEKAPVDENGMTEAEYDAMLAEVNAASSPVEEAEEEEKENAEEAVNAAALASTATVKYYFFNGQRIGMEESNGSFRYLHNDHLGSTVSSTNWGTGTYKTQKYYAYGARRTPSNSTFPTDNRFTGQKLDTTGLDVLQ